MAPRCLTSRVLAVIMLFAPCALGDEPGYPPLLRPTVSALARPEGSNPVDAFVRDAQIRVGLSGSPEADRATLIRRLSLDLCGLPPTPEQVLAFERDTSPDAYERLVDRLLASPSFGERQAVRWLDLARYADSAGFEEDTRRPTAWRYRDWVIRAFNTDMPYDQFLGYQIAVDELAADQPQHLAALGFLRAGATVGNERNDRTRADELDDMVSTTASVFLGLTVGCARCHDHKSDPIPTTDYYRLVAVFAPSRPAELPLVTPEAVARHRAAESAVLAVQEQIHATRPPSASDDLTRSVIAEHQGRIDAWDLRKPAPLPSAPGVKETGPFAGATHVLIRGEVGRIGEEVLPGPPRWVSEGTIDFPEPSRRARSSLRRSSLALWMTDRRNPLTARVIVNRIWQGHFGKGLIATTSDLGTSSEPPAIPGLLDWLACELMDRRWSLKSIHRLIVTSATYRQSSRLRDDAVRVDPGDRLVWRYPLRRLDAEVIRDATLFCSGSLNPIIGGPGVFPPIDPSLIRTGNLPRWPLDAVDGLDVWRKSVYLFKLRSVPHPMLELLDQPDTQRSCPERFATTTATQSLMLMNDPTRLTQARLLAHRVAVEAGKTSAERVDRLFLIVTGKRPGVDSKAAAIEHLESARRVGAERDALTDLALALYNSNAFLYVD